MLFTDKYHEVLHRADKSKCTVRLLNKWDKWGIVQSLRSLFTFLLFAQGRYSWVVNRPRPPGLNSGYDMCGITNDLDSTENKICYWQYCDVVFDILSWNRAPGCQAKSTEFTHLRYSWTKSRHPEQGQIVCIFNCHAANWMPNISQTPPYKSAKSKPYALLLLLILLLLPLLLSFPLLFFLPLPSSYHFFLVGWWSLPHLLNWTVDRDEVYE